MNTYLEPGTGTVQRLVTHRRTRFTTQCCSGYRRHLRRQNVLRNETFTQHCLSDRVAVQMNNVGTATVACSGPPGTVGLNRGPAISVNPVPAPAEGYKDGEGTSVASPACTLK